MIQPERQKSKHFRKNKKVRKVDLQEELMPIIVNYAKRVKINLKTKGDLFPEECRLKNDSQRYVHRRIRKGVGMLLPIPIPEFTTYSLRHTIITNAVGGLSDLGKLPRLATHFGHSVQQMFTNYVHEQVETTQQNSLKGIAKSDINKMLKKLKRLERLGAPASAIATLREWAAGK